MRSYQGFPATSIHGDRLQSEREQVLDFVLWYLGSFWKFLLNLLSRRWKTSRLGGCQSWLLQLLLQEALTSPTWCMLSSMFLASLFIWSKSKRPFLLAFAKCNAICQVCDWFFIWSEILFTFLMSFPLQLWHAQGVGWIHSQVALYDLNV